MTDAHGTAFHAGAHPDGSTIAAFVDRALTDHERSALLAHFASCSDCRREMTDVQAAVLATARPASTSRGRSWRWLVPLAAAAVLILAVRPPRPSPVPAGDAPSRVRGADAGPAADGAAEPGRLAVVEPADGDTLGGERLLAWRAGGADATYEVTVQDSSGASVWNAPLSDTTTAIPAGTPLRKGALYYWSVDVRRADGSTGRSIVHRFVAP